MTEPTLQVCSNLLCKIHVKLNQLRTYDMIFSLYFPSLDSTLAAHLPRVDRPSSCRKSYKHCEVAAHSLVTWGLGIGKQKEKQVERATSHTCGRHVAETAPRSGKLCLVPKSNSEQSPSFSLSFFQSMRSTCSGLKASRIASDRK